MDCTAAMINTNVNNHTQTQSGLQPVFGFEPLGPRLRLLPGDPIADELGINQGELLKHNMVVIQFHR